MIQDLAISDDEIMRRLPHDKPRRGQLAVIKMIMNAYLSGKRYVILEAPTGSGKSAIGITVSRFFKDCFYLTIQKILQAQIIRDYGASSERDHPIEELKGRNAYPCTFYDLHARKLVQLKAMTQKTVDDALKHRPDCGRGYCKRALSKFKCQQCFPPNGATQFELEAWRARNGAMYSTCQYYEQVERAMASHTVLMNFSSFLFQTQYTKRFPQRELLIVDEGHHSEPQLMDFVSLTISDMSFHKKGIKIPEFDDPREYAVWFNDHGIEAEIIRMIHESRKINDNKTEDEMSRLYYKYKRFMTCVTDGMVDWVCEYTEHPISGGTSFRTITLKPVFIHHFANDLLFNYGVNTLIMSATILDAGVMAKSLGIDKDDIAFFRMSNYFPKENRPIYIRPAAKIVGGKDKMKEWGPALVKMVDFIVDHYPDDRGIVHTHNFAIADMFMNQCKNKQRFLFQRNFSSKEALLNEHSLRTNGVIVAPAMHEGLDLKDDLSRFQIISKVPYPNFFEDKQLAKRVEIDRKYLIWLVALKLVQSYGRSVRSGEDWAHTYIIDEAIERFLKESHKMLPEWFKEAIIRD